MFFHLSAVWGKKWKKCPLFSGCETTPYMYKKREHWREERVESRKILGRSWVGRGGLGASCDRVGALPGLAGRRWRGRGFGARPSARTRIPARTGSGAWRKRGGSGAPRSPRTAPSPRPRTPARGPPEPPRGGGERRRVAGGGSRSGGACTARSRRRVRACELAASSLSEPDLQRERERKWKFLLMMWWNWREENDESWCLENGEWRMKSVVGVKWMWRGNL